MAGAPSRLRGAWCPNLWRRNVFCQRKSRAGRSPPTCTPGRVPRHVDARGLVTAFDSLVWERSRMERLFGMKYTIEMYVPPPKRIYGYYVCPFVLGDTLVAR